MTKNEKVDYNKLSNEELARMDLIKKAESRDKAERYKKTGFKAAKWSMLILGAIVLILVFFIFKIMSGMFN